MPQIPVYGSQVSAGGVPATPQASAEDFGAATGKAIESFGKAGVDFVVNQARAQERADALARARDAADANRGNADAMRELSGIEQKDRAKDDPSTWSAQAEQELAAVEAKYRALGSGAYNEAAVQTVKSLGPAILAATRHRAVKHEIALHQGNLDDDVEFYAGQAAAASNDLERQININMAKTAIARANAAGFITRDDALARLRALPGSIEEKQVEALIKSDPTAALEALEDPKQYRHLAPDSRELYQGKAKLADQHAQFATVSATQQGIADGSKGHDDVDALFKDGLIGEATRKWLDERVEEAAKERAEKAEGRQRVDTALREGGKLDLKKAKDQAAVDAYHDSVVAPANPDSPTLVSYIRRIGVVPTKVAQSIKGGLASDEPRQAVNAANLIRELGKGDDALVKGFGAQRLKFARAVMDGIDGGLSAQRAVDLADKSHGQPDASADDGTQYADAEGGSAGDGGTEKGGKAPRGEVRWVDDEGGYYGVFVDGVERTGADTEAKAKALLADILAREKQRPAQPGKGESDKDEGTAAGAEGSADAEARVADKSGGSDTSGHAEGGADVAAETVGPEMQPVGGTEDNADESDQPNMVERFARRLQAAIERAFEEPIGLDPEDIQALREAGLFRTGSEGRFDPMATIRTFNEILIGGGIAGIDLSGRLGEALINVIAAAVAQTAQEFGESETGSRMLERDLGQLIQFMLMLGMTRGPSGPRRPPRGLEGKTAGEAASSARKLRRRDQLAAELTGKEMTSKRGYSHLRSAAEAEAKKLQGLTVDSPALSGVSQMGSKIRISGNGLDKAISTAYGPGAKIKLRMFPAIPDILRKGWLDRSLPPRDPAVKPNTRMYHYIRANVRMDGRDYLVEAVVREDNNGNLFYDFDLTTRREMQAGRFSMTMGAGAAGAGATLSGDVPNADTANENQEDASDSINLTILE